MMLTLFASLLLAAPGPAAPAAAPAMKVPEAPRIEVLPKADEAPAESKPAHVKERSVPKPPPPPPSSADTAKPAAPAADEKLTITADKAASQKAGKDDQGRDLTRARFTGHVEAVRGDVKLQCDSLDVVFALDQSKPAADGDDKRGVPQSAKASGSVVVTMPGRRAVGDEAVYDMAAGTVTLSGGSRPVLYHESDAVAAEKFVLHRDPRITEARGKVSAMIQPRKDDKGDKAPGDKKPAVEGPSAAKKTRVDAAEGALYDENSRVLYLKGQVVVQQEGFRLSCNELWAFLEPAGEKDGKAKDPLVAGLGVGALSRLVGSGGVWVDTETRTISAELAQYDAATRTTVLAGKSPVPAVHEPGRLLTAPQIVHHLADDSLEARGGPFKVTLEGEKSHDRKLKPWEKPKSSSK